MPDTATTLPSFSAGDILNRNSDFYVRLRDENNLATISRSLLVAVLGASFFGWWSQPGLTEFLVTLREATDLKSRPAPAAAPLG